MILESGDGDSLVWHTDESGTPLDTVYFWKHTYWNIAAHSRLLIASFKEFARVDWVVKRVLVVDLREKRFKCQAFASYTKPRCSLCQTPCVIDYSLQLVLASIYYKHSSRVLLHEPSMVT